MTKTISALDLHYLIQELQFLIGARVDKVFVPRKKEVVLELFVRAKGKFFLKIDEKSLYTTQKPKTRQPTDFCMFFRKKLMNARIKALTQIDFERIIELTLETKTEEFKIVAELFSKGNILLTKNNKILVAAEYQNWKDRTIRPNVEYKHSVRANNFLKITSAELKEILNNSNKESIVKSLAVDLGLGGAYAEEACFNAKIDKDMPIKEIKSFTTLYKELDKLRNKKLQPVIVYKNKEILDLLPFPLNIYKKQEKAESFNLILNDYFSNIDAIKEKAKQNEQLDKIKKIIKSQKEDIKKLGLQEIENHEKAELLYNNYQLVSSILKELSDISKEHSWDEIKKKLKGHKIIKEVTSKDKSIVIELK